MDLDGSAHLGLDYRGTLAWQDQYGNPHTFSLGQQNTIVTFPVSVARLEVWISPIDDLEAEGTEEIMLQVQASPDGAYVTPESLAQDWDGKMGYGIATLEDNEAAVLLEETQGSTEILYEVGQDGTVTWVEDSYYVHLSARPEALVEVIVSGPTDENSQPLLLFSHDGEEFSGELHLYFTPETWELQQ